METGACLGVVVAGASRMDGMSCIILSWILLKSGTWPILRFLEACVAVEMEEATIDRAGTALGTEVTGVG